jgi:uncharacterized protein (DUF2235 family)
MKGATESFCLASTFASSKYFTPVNGVSPPSGFSRGAYEARVISGMIEKVKLIFQFSGVMTYSLFQRLVSSSQQTSRMMI